jgi:hypothetical protein
MCVFRRLCTFPPVGVWLYWLFGIFEDPISIRYSIGTSLLSTPPEMEGPMPKIWSERVLPQSQLTFRVRRPKVATSRLKLLTARSNLLVERLLTIHRVGNTNTEIPPFTQLSNSTFLSFSCSQHSCPRDFSSWLALFCHVWAAGRVVSGLQRAPRIVYTRRRLVHI